MQESVHDLGIHVSTFHMFFYSSTDPFSEGALFDESGLYCVVSEKLNVSFT